MYSHARISWLFSTRSMGIAIVHSLRSSVSVALTRQRVRGERPRNLRIGVVGVRPTGRDKKKKKKKKKKTLPFIEPTVAAGRMYIVVIGEGI